MPGATTRARRQLARRGGGVSLDQDRTRAANRLHALLDMHGRRVDASRQHLNKATGQVVDMAFGGGKDGVDTAVLQPYAAQIETLNEAIKGIRQRIGVESEADEDAVLPMSITGLGSYSAMVPSAEIDGISASRESRHGPAGCRITWLPRR